MSKDYRFALLLDYYGNMLTDKQRDFLDLYYNEDLSLSEIAEHEKITRQGVHDSIRRGEELLSELDAKLGYADRLARNDELLEKIGALAAEIYNECRTYNYSRSTSDRAKELLDCLDAEKTEE